jgi:hypothetical protein
MPAEDYDPINLLTVAERFLCGLATTTESALHGQAFLTFGIKYPQKTSELQRPVLDAGYGQRLWPDHRHTI